MPKKEVFQLHPLGWETDPQEERFKVSTLDYLTACTYNNYAIYFRLNDADKPRVVEILKAGLERTLSQTRHLCGIIEKDEEGGHSFVKKQDSTVRFEVQWLDAPEEKHISFDEIEQANFSAIVMGDLNTWSVPPMTYGEKPEAHPDNRPVAAAYKANFIRGGLVFIMHHHHYANDVMGWSGLTHQLAENCYAHVNQTPFPAWDPACLDLSRLTKPQIPEASLVDGPPAPQRHPDHTVSESLFFHLPKSKAAELKKLATPTPAPPNGPISPIDTVTGFLRRMLSRPAPPAPTTTTTTTTPADVPWISTYDAFCAFIWRTVTRVRAPIFKPDLTQPLFWAEAVDMRRRFHSPKVAPRIQHNVMSAALSINAPVPAPTAGEIISEWPLSRLAGYIRQLTNSTTQEALDEALSGVATVRDKTALNIRSDSFPPLSILFTDHRDARITAADFGFASPVTYRHLLDSVSAGVFIIYPPRDEKPGSDEGPEFTIAFERELKHLLLEDEEWNKYFEFRGVDAIDAARA